ncbi:MAG: protein-tyrosine phosphatase family protein [Spirochaetota bacterium]
MHERSRKGAREVSAEEVASKVDAIQGDTPLSRCYWVAYPLLLAGVYPGSVDPDECRRKLRSLSGAGIRTFVNLMEERESGHDGRPIQPYEAIMVDLAAEIDTPLVMRRFAIRDVSVPSRRTMRSILDAIDDEHSAGSAVYVHCWGGRGRTGTVIGCWLVRHGIASGDKALHAIELLRRDVPDRAMPSPETSEQVDMVRTWKEEG